MKTILGLTALIFIWHNCTIGQESHLWESIYYRKAIENNTRNRNGILGEKYWQNHSDYDMTIEMDADKAEIKGSATITYYNNSPDTLKKLVFRLYPNMRKKGAERNMKVHPDDLTDGVGFDTLNINGKGIEVNNKVVIERGTNYIVRLSDAIAPDQSAQIYCEWIFPVEKGSSFRRTGYYKDKAWFIGYFYPQIAVYDDMEGWDNLLFHLGVQEFYNDFNNYKVNITVPEGSYVWATGDLMNAEDIYTSTVTKRLEEAGKSSEVISILGEADKDKNYLKANSWQFNASNVPDFAFGVAEDYYWDATSIISDNKKVTIDVVYHPQSAPFKSVADISKKSIKFAVEKFPQIKFPYHKICVFNGLLGGGMEFPMIVNNESFDYTVINYHLTFHEIFHNYFPFMTGCNEKRYPFMDEGLTSFYTDEFTQDILNDDCYKFYSKDSSLYGTYERLFKYGDFPLIQSYASVNDYNATNLYYVKPTIAFRLFMEMIGKEAFIKGMQEFVERWTGKHPTPWDLFYTFNDVLGKDYNWFWDAWFFSAGYPDLALRVDEGKIVIERVGRYSLPLPIHLKITLRDGKEVHINKKADIWEDGKKEYRITLDNIYDIRSIEILKGSVPDIDLENNKLEL